MSHHHFSGVVCAREEVKDKREGQSIPALLPMSKFVDLFSYILANNLDKLYIGNQNPRGDIDVFVVLTPSLS